MSFQESRDGAIIIRKKVELLESKMAPCIFLSILLRASVQNNWFQVEKLL